VEKFAKPTKWQESPMKNNATPRINSGAMDAATTSPPLLDPESLFKSKPPNSTQRAQKTSRNQKQSQKRPPPMPIPSNAMLLKKNPQKTTNEDVKLKKTRI
jgi:hypothetical protein